MKPQRLGKTFVVIGENLHATRVLLRNGKHIVTVPSGEDAIFYTGSRGETHCLIIPEEFRRRQDYQEGRVKHVAVAIHSAMSGVAPAAVEGMEYLRNLVERQVSVDSGDTGYVVATTFGGVRVNSRTGHQYLAAGSQRQRAAAAGVLTGDPAIGWTWIRSFPPYSETKIEPSAPIAIPVG